MKNIYLSVFLFSIVLLSCQSQEAVTEIVEVPALRASSIYEADSVVRYMELYKEQYKELSDAYQKKSSDIENENMDKAIYYCKRAITLHPSMDQYITLAIMLMKDKRYEEAYRLYHLLVNKHTIYEIDGEVYLFNSPPTEEMRYQLIALSVLNYGGLDSYEIYRYKEEGYDVKKLGNRLLSDQRLKIDTSIAEYKDFKLMFMTDDELEQYQTSEQVFREFLASIEDTASFFEINSKQVQHFKYNRSYDYEMDENIKGSSFYVYFLQEKKENPNRWYNYNYNHVFPVHTNITAVVYSIDTSEAGCPIDMRHIYHRLAIFNDKGDLLDHKVIAFQSGDDLATASFAKNNVIVKSFKRKWRNPYNMKDFDNDLLNSQEAGSVRYTITTEGKITQAAAQEESVVTPL